MSIEMCILASGSGGNCTVVRTPSGTMLIDAGIGPLITARRMNGTGVSPRDVSAVCLTHLDRDHFSPNWSDWIESRGVRVFCHRSHCEKIHEICAGGLRGSTIGFDGPFEPLPGLSMRPLAVAHDAKECFGYLIQGFGCRIGYATDLGHVPDELLAAFETLDILAIESNYDLRMQIDSARPGFLKQRIMGGRGHLSNDQAFAAVRAILDRHEAAGDPLPRHVVLLHRSRQCNCPRLVRQLFLRDARLAERLTLAEQYERSPWLRVRRTAPLIGEQLVLGWG